jgi:hypothetical protein
MKRLQVSAIAVIESAVALAHAAILFGGDMAFYKAKRKGLVAALSKLDDAMGLNESDKD